MTATPRPGQPDEPVVTATVTPSGRWSWDIAVSVARGDGWIGRTVVQRTVFGTRARADRAALRLVRRQAKWQRRLVTDTHTVAERRTPTSPGA